jgi:hypothetical protein
MQLKLPFHLSTFTVGFVFFFPCHCGVTHLLVLTCFMFAMQVAYNSFVLQFGNAIYLQGAQSTQAFEYVFAQS